jgi:predicted membrane protein
MDMQWRMIYQALCIARVWSLGFRMTTLFVQTVSAEVPLTARFCRYVYLAASGDTAAAFPFQRIVKVNVETGDSSFWQAPAGERSSVARQRLLCWTSCAEVLPPLHFQRSSVKWRSLLE